MDNPLWRAVGQIVLRVVLGEIAPHDALGEVLASAERSLAVSCAFEDLVGRTVATSSRSADSGEPGKAVSRVSVDVSGVDGHATGRLVFSGVVDATVGNRLARVVEHLTSSDAQLAMARRTATQQARHQLRNTVARALANIELVELLLEGSTPSAPLLEGASVADRADLVQAVTLAADAVRTLATSFGASPAAEPEEPA